MALRKLSSGKALLRGAKFALGAAAAVVIGGSATALTVAEVVDKDGRIVQRDIGATTKGLTVSGTYTGAPSLIQVRFVPRTGSASAWVSLAASPTGGTFSGTYACPQSLYQGKVQVRCSVATTVTATTTRNHAVGVMIVMPGQSNLRFLSEVVINYPLASLDNRRYRYLTDDWQQHGNYDATGAYAPGTPFSTYGSTRTDVTPDRGDGIVAFTNALSAALGCAVGTIECSVTGTNMASWLPTTGTNWLNLEIALAESGGDAELWLHLQGEDDASGSTAAATWQAGAQSMYNRALALTGRTSAQLHWGVGVLGTATTYATEGRFAVIRSAQLAFLAANANAFLMASFTEAPIQDPVHYATTYRVRQGLYMAFTSAAKLVGSPKPGPSIASASRSGAVITVPIAGGTGTLKDGAGGSGTSLQGFRVYANGSLLTISSIVISGNNVVITLSATPTGTITLDYAMANAPYGSTPAAASILYDSGTVTGDTIGLPLRPCALITVS